MKGNIATLHPIRRHISSRDEQRIFPLYAVRWSEFDLDRAILTLPADRIKSSREHHIPLSPHAIAILKDLKKQDL